MLAQERCGKETEEKLERRGEGTEEGPKLFRFFPVLTYVQLLVDNDLLRLRSDAIKKLVRWGCDEH